MKHINLLKVLNNKFLKECQKNKKIKFQRDYKLMGLYFILIMYLRINWNLIIINHISGKQIHQDFVQQLIFGMI